MVWLKKGRRGRPTCGCPTTGCVDAARGNRKLARPGEARASGRQRMTEKTILIKPFLPCGRVAAAWKARMAAIVPARAGREALSCCIQDGLISGMQRSRRLPPWPAAFFGSPGSGGVCRGTP